MVQENTVPELNPRCYIILQQRSSAGTVDIYSNLSVSLRMAVQLIARLSKHHKSENHTASRKNEGGSPPQTSNVTIEVVLVSGNGTSIGVLPESVVAPSSGQSANAARMSGDPQRVSGTESCIVTGASVPPIGGSVNDRPTADTIVVGAGEIVDPADH